MNLHLLPSFDWKRMMPLIVCFAFVNVLYVRAQVSTGGNATTADHQKEIIGYITNWDAWKSSAAGLPSAGALTHLNIDYSKYTILNYSFFGVAVDGSLHSGDLRNKNIHQDGQVQQPADIFFTSIYDSWDMLLLFGETEPVHYISEAIKTRAEAQGFVVEVNGTTWQHPSWGLAVRYPFRFTKKTVLPVYSTSPTRTALSNGLHRRLEYVQTFSGNGCRPAKKSSLYCRLPETYRYWF